MKNLIKALMIFFLIKLRSPDFLISILYAKGYFD